MSYPKHIKNIRILQIVPQLKHGGGVERGTLDMFRYLNKFKIKNYIFCENFESDLLTELEQKCVFTSNGLKFKNLLNYFKLNSLLSFIIKKNKINIVHISSRAPAFIFYRNIKMKKIKYVTSFHNPYKGILLKKFYNSYLLKGDVIVCNSNYTKKYVLDNFNIDIKKIFSVPRGTDIQYFNSKSISQTAIKSKKKSLNISDEDIVISIPSRFSRWKGHSKIFSFLSFQPQNFIQKLKLILIIDKQKINHKEFIKKCDPILKDNIIIIEPTRNIRDIYAISDIIVSCSLKPEGFGRTISESLAMNKIPIGSNCGGVREQLEPFDKKLLFDINDPSSFKKSLNHSLKLLKNKNFNGRDYICNNYSLTNMLATTFSIYISQ